MILRQRRYVLKTEDNLKGHDLQLIVNGKNKGISYKEVIFDSIIKDNKKIVGWSPLEYMNVLNGKLTNDEGISIHFFDKTTNKEILVESIEVPFLVWNDKEISAETVDGISRKILDIKQSGTSVLPEKEKESLTEVQKEVKMFFDKGYFVKEKNNVWALVKPEARSYSLKEVEGSPVLTRLTIESDNEKLSTYKNDDFKKVVFDKESKTLTIE